MDWLHIQHWVEIVFLYLEKFRYPKCGTPGFVAPEVINYNNGTYDKVCDIFSCGVIFYKLLTGKDVFPGSGFNYVL